jgi:hypothetical protein
VRAGRKSCMTANDRRVPTLGLGGVARRVLHVEQLIRPGVVNTMPEATLRAFADHGRAEHVLRPRGWPTQPCAARGKRAGCIQAKLRSTLDRAA